jgi:hypothetical protein
MGIDNEFVKNVAVPRAIVVSACTGVCILVWTIGWNIWNATRKPKLSIEIEKSRGVPKANGAVDFQLNLTLTSSKGKLYLKEAYLFRKPFWLFLSYKILKLLSNIFPLKLDELQIKKGIICKLVYPLNVWATDLIDFCNQPVLARCSFDRFADNYGKDVRNIEIEENSRVDLIFVGTVYEGEKVGIQCRAPLSNWYIYIDYGVGKITSKAFA